MRHIFIDRTRSHNKVNTDAREDFFTDMTMKTHDARCEDARAIVTKLIEPMLVDHVLGRNLDIDRLSPLHDPVAKVCQENGCKH